MKLKISLLLIISVVASYCFAQTAIIPTTGVLTGSNGYVNYTLGQVFYSTNSGTTGTEIQGIHQAYKIETPTSLSKDYEDIKCVLFPNPTKGNITLDIDISKHAALFYSIINTQGQELHYAPVESNITQLNFDRLNPSVYLVKIIEEKQIIKTYKITKL